MQTLMLLLQHAESDRDAALALNQRAAEALRTAEAQLEQLVGYRRDYEARWQAQFATSGQIEVVRCYHDFMARLTQAVEQQQHAVQAAGLRRDETQRTLRERELRVASVGKLIERRSREIRLNAERREQKQFDELAARMSRQALMGAAFAVTR